MSVGSGFQVLQKVVLGVRKQGLTPREVQMLMASDVTPEMILYIINAMNHGKMDPNSALIESISKAKSKNDLIPIALALRYGANPNIYVAEKDIGDMHVIGFVYSKISKNVDPAVVNGIIIMLRASGSNPMMSIFDDNGGKIKKGFTLGEPRSGQNVIQWLNNSGFENILSDISSDFTSVDDSFLTILGTYLNRDDLAKTKPSLTDVMLSHSNVVLSKYLDEYTLDDGLLKSFKYLNLSGYRKFVDNGAQPDYSLTNRMIIRMNNYDKVKDPISSGQIREMLMYSVKHGLPLDRDQINMISTNNKNTISELNKIYEVPKWKKECSNVKIATSPYLRTLASNLNINPELPKDSMCNYLKKMNEADPNKLNTAAITRQKIKVSTDTSEINTFINGTPDAVCRNRSLFENDPFEYNDLSLSYYKDDSGALWCFTSDQYGDLLSRKINPSTTQPLPKSFLEQLQHKLDNIKKLNIPHNNPTTFKEAISSLNQKDKISNNIYNSILDSWYNTLLLNGITKDSFNSIKPEQLQEIIQALNIPTSDNNNPIDLTQLTHSHATKTFSLTIYNLIEKDPSLSPDIFMLIKSKL